MVAETLTFGEVVSQVERIYQSKMVEMQRMESENLRIPNSEVRERIVELRGFLKGLRKIYDVVQQERVENLLWAE